MRGLVSVSVEKPGMEAYGYDATYAKRHGQPRTVKHLSIGTVSPLSRAQRQKASSRRRGTHDSSHRVSYAQESPTVSGSRRRLLRSSQRRADQALFDTQTRAPRSSSYCSEPDA